LSPNTPSLVGLDYFDRLADLGLPLHLEQDLNATALAEYHFGAGQGAARLLTAAIGTGLGAAVIVEGEVLRFAGNTAGDNGHIILDPGGPACTAGCQGCAEALTTVAAIERAALERQAEPAAAALRLAAVDGRISAHAVIAAARAGDTLATDIMRGIGLWLGQWLASLAPIFLPERVVLCGGVTEAGESLLEAASERLHALSGPDYSRCTVALGQFGSRSGVVGAAVPYLLEA
jgi:glucokinase